MKTSMQHLRSMKRALNAGGRACLLTGALAAALSGCGQQQQSAGDVLVTDLQHSRVKRQSIGNCWLYATATWAESLHLEATGQEVDISESYWTYWHWYNQIRNSSVTEISTGGWWRSAAAIIAEHGYVLEGDFLPHEANAQMSNAQSVALGIVNAALASGGSLSPSSNRGHDAVIALLNQAFGVDIESVSNKVKPADSLVVGIQADGGETLLSDLVSMDSDQRWVEQSYPRVWGIGNSADAGTRSSRSNLLKRVMRALNDGKPVVMSFLVDFNALNPENGRFEREYFTTRGSVTGKQGGHLLVLEDYTVTDVPGIGAIGEGDVGEELQELALQGRLSTLIAKNSWGTDRPERGLTDGYTRFTMDWLDTPHPWDELSAGYAYSPLTEFILPAGY